MNPEQNVIDAIDALVDEQLAEGPVDDYSVNRYDKCALCKLDWHGLPDDTTGCPGAYARGYQKRKYQARARWRIATPYEDAVTEVQRRMARAAAANFEREFLNSLSFTGQVYGEAERELRPEEWSEIYGVPIGQLGIDPPQPRYEQLDLSHHFVPQPRYRYDMVEWRTGQAQQPSSAPRDSRPCVQCQRPLEWRAAYTFGGSSPLCHDCYDMRVRRARENHERTLRRLEQWGQGWSDRPWAAISQAEQRCTQCQRTLVSTYQDGGGVLCQECMDSRLRVDRARRDRNDHLMREILAAIPREGVSGDGIRTGQFDISQDAVHRLRTSGT